MKQQGTKTPASKPVAQNKQSNRPENKDNLDSRANEEQEFKGDDVTNNKKETKEHHLKKS